METGGISAKQTSVTGPDQSGSGREQGTIGVGEPALGEAYRLAEAGDG